MGHYFEAGTSQINCCSTCLDDQLSWGLSSGDFERCSKRLDWSKNRRHPKKTEQLEKIMINIDKPWYTIKFWTTQFSDIQESRTLLFWKPRRVMVYVDGWWTQVSGQKLKPSLSSCCPLLQKEESNIINLVVQQGQFTSVYYAQRMW